MDKPHLDILERIHAAYEHGVKEMTPEDLDKVLADEKKAKEKLFRLFLSIIRPVIKENFVIKSLLVAEYKRQSGCP